MTIDTSKLIRTCDLYVWAEELRKGYARYVDVKTGRRWEVLGECSKIGKCWEGAADPGARVRVEAEGMDCPVAPGFNDCGCCQFEFKELPPAEV